MLSIIRTNKPRNTLSCCIQPYAQRYKKMQSIECDKINCTMCRERLHTEQMKSYFSIPRLKMKNSKCCCLGVNFDFNVGTKYSTNAGSLSLHNITTVDLWPPIIIITFNNVRKWKWFVDFWKIPNSLHKHVYSIDHEIMQKISMSVLPWLKILISQI